MQFKFTSRTNIRVIIAIKYYCCHFVPQAISSFLNALVEVILVHEQKKHNSSFMYSLLSSKDNFIS